MPHAENPTQLSIDESILVDNSGYAMVHEPDRFADPRGQYVTSAVLYTEADSTGITDLFKIENEGVDLRLVRIEVAQSQGAEDGRAAWNYGWDINDEQYASELIASHVGTDGGSRHRSYQNVDFTQDTFQPLFEFKDEMYVNVSADSDTAGDTVKCRSKLYFVPDEDTSNSGNRL